MAPGGFGASTSGQSGAAVKARQIVCFVFSFPFLFLPSLSLFSFPFPQQRSGWRLGG